MSVDNSPVFELNPKDYDDPDIEEKYSIIIYNGRNFAIDKEFIVYSDAIGNVVDKDYYIHDIKDFKSFNILNEKQKTYLQTIANNINKEYTVKKVLSCNSLKNLKSYTPEQLLRINEIFTKIYRIWEEYLSVIDMYIPLHIATTKQFLNKCGKDVEKFEGEKIVSILRRSLPKPRYWTHDNDGRSFEVEIDGKNVAVYKFQEDSFIREDIPILTYYNCKNIFVGIDKLMYCDGNSILLNINDLDYVFIGDSVKSFTSLAPIVSFISPLYGSDSAYPTAIDENDICYLLDENVIVFDYFTQDEYNDPHLYYYENFGDKSSDLGKYILSDNNENINKIRIFTLIYILKSDIKLYLKSITTNEKTEITRQWAKDAVKVISENKCEYLEHKIIIPRL